MTIQKALHSYLLSIPAITSIVGTRVYANHLPEVQVYPAITIRLISAEHGRNLDGPNGRVTASVQIESWSNVFTQSLDLAEEVRTAVQGYRGMMGDLRIRVSSLEEDIDTPEPPDDNSQDWVYAKALQFNLLYVETIPSHS